MGVAKEKGRRRGTLLREPERGHIVGLLRERDDQKRGGGRIPGVRIEREERGWLLPLVNSRGR